MIGPRFLVELGRACQGPIPEPAGCPMTPVIDTGGCRICVESGSVSLLLPGGAGVIIGRLFRSGERLPVDILRDEEVDEILQTRGGALAKHYWGAFVAILYLQPAAEFFIYRDPSPEKPCYYTDDGQGIALASDFMLLRNRPGWRSGFDWAAITALLWRPDIRPRRTGIEGVSELLAGERLTVAGKHREHDMLWTPWDFAMPSRFHERQSEAVDALREAVDGTVGGWAGVFRHIVLGVSGGLDSSIVATVIAETPTKLTMATLATRGRAGDERSYCRELGRYLGDDVLELWEDPDLVDLRRSDAAHLPRPVARAFSQSADRSFVEIGAREEADAYFTGGGGDNVFCYLTSGAPLADRLKVEGVGSGSFRTALDISRLTGASIFAVAGNAIRRGWLREPAYRWPLKSRFLDPASIDAVREVGDHPWMRVPPGGLPGKATHIAWLLGIQNYLEGFARERTLALISPLMAQPVMEACLRIPTWLWVDGGINRACARLAYADRLPERIVSRTSKGTPDSFVIELIEQRRAEIADILLSGHLVSAGIADAEAIEQRLNEGSLVTDASFVNLMKLVDVEAWLSSIDIV